ncbi:MAG: hypothetical protein JNG85_06415, partial [Spirochaetaceae bacterium]|nr:hypothetical protein [Spirochaetaceae bacterium]
MPLAPRLSTLRGVLFALALCLAASPLSAMGSKEPPRERASGLEDWEHGFDISKLPAGKYNIVVEGRDKAGNVSLAGPINVFVDPASDLPRVSIVNPLPLMRVGADLNVVGTCVDDDGVARVEVSVDGGEFRPAEGGEFWSLYLATKDLPDGRRSLAVRGVDVNGLAGPVSKVSFNLDRSKPLASVGGVEPGALVAGAVKLEGEVLDANGVASLEASFDGAKSFTKVELKRGKDATRAAFSLAFDSRKFPDGPRVVWLKSADAVGSKGSAAFLLVVDNTKPAIEFLRPAKEAAVNGRFVLVGAARDAVGLKRLSYEFGGVDKGEIALTPGNSYFVKEFDTRPLKGDKADMVLVAEDRIGNVTRLALAPRIDRKADKPVVRVAFPAPEGRVRGGDLVWGRILDDDGAAALRVSVDGGAPFELPASEHFAVKLPELASGRHVLSLAAVDVDGALGDPVSLPLAVDGGPGALSFLRVSSAAAGARDYAPGLEVRLDQGAVLEGRLAAPNPPAKAEWSVAGGAPRKLEFQKSAEGYSFRLALDRSLPYGFAPVEVRSTDSFGNETLGRALVYALNLGAIREDTGFRFDDPRVADGRVMLSKSEPLLGAFYREDLASLRFEPPTDIVAASFDGRTVALAAVKEGATPPLRLVGTTKLGHAFEAGPFAFACDAEAPRIVIESPAEGLFAKTRFEARGRVEDSGGLASLRWIPRPGAAPRELKPAADGRFSFFVEPAADQAGPTHLEIVAEDASGNLARAFRSYALDADPPVVRFLSPPEGAVVSGAEDVAAVVEDASGLSSVEFAADGAAFAPIERRGTAFIHRADLAANAKAAYRVTDRAGNVAVARPQVAVSPRAVVAPAADAVAIEPGAEEAKIELAGSAGARKISLVVPAVGEAAFGDFGFAEGREPPERFRTRLLVSGALSLKGKAASAGKVKAVSWSQDGGATYLPLFQAKDAKSVAAEAPIVLTLDSTKLPDGEARVLLRLEDEAGLLRFAPLYLVVDNAAPSVSFIAPAAAGAAGSSGATTATAATAALSLAGPSPIVARLVDARGPVAAELSLGAEKRSLPVAEGGSYYAAWADPEAAAAAAKGAPLAVSLAVRDAAGNAAGAALKLSYDAQADAPRIDLSLPAVPSAVAPAVPAAAASKGATAIAPLALSPGEALAGSAADDDGAAELTLSFDGGETVSFPTGAFALALPELAAGRHELRLEAKDESGKISTRKMELLVRGPAPLLSDAAFGAGTERSPWSPGAAVALAAGSVFAGKVAAPNGLVSLEYSVAGGPAQKAVLGKPEAGAASPAPVPFTAALPASLPYERFVVEVVARDAAGLATSRRYDFHAVLPAAPGAPPADDADGLRFHDERLTSADGKQRALLAVGDRLAGRWNGRPLRSVAVEPAGAVLAASFDGAAVLLEAKAEGLSPAAGFKVVAVTVDGDRAEWGPLVLAVDAAPPALSLETPADAAWTKGPTRLSGRAEDPNGVAAVEVSVNGGAWTRLEAKLAAPPAPPAPPAAPAALAAGRPPAGLRPVAPAPALPAAPAASPGPSAP